MAPITPVADPLRRRMMKATVIKLHLEENDGDKFSRQFALAYDFNAMSLVESETGKSMLERSIWSENSTIVLASMFRAGVLMYHPEYASPEGYDVIRSYMDAGNIEQITEAINEAFVSSLSKEKQERIRAVQAKQKADAQNPTNPADGQPAPAATTTAAA